MSIIQGTSKTSAAGGYAIKQSIRFNFSDAAHLLRTPSTASNRRTWTWSLWVKRSGLGNPGGPNQVHQLFGVGAGSCLRFTSSDQLRLETPAGNHTFVTSQVFRDTSAWYHIVLAFDSTQATDTNRRKLYVNGSQVTDFSSTTFTGLAQNAEWDINSTSQHQIAKSNLADYFGGYLAELNFVDGQALDPTSFGETNADTGQWVPVEYTGSYGTNGFYLKGQDSSALGDDSSGNNNDWTSSGLAAADQVTDTPTNNFCVLSPIDKNSNFTLSDGNLTNSNGTNAHAACFSTIAFDASDTDGWYWEVTMDSLQSTGFAVLIADEAVNQTDITTDPTTQPAEGNLWAHRRYNSASDGAITGVGSTGSWTSYGPAAVVNDVIGYCVKNGKLFIAINNTWLESSDPDTEASPAFSNLTGNLRVGVNRFGDTGTDVTTLNFGQTGFTYTPPTGAKAISTANLDDPTIALPEKYFNTVLYEGNGGGQRVGGFQPITETYSVPNSVIFNDNDSAYLNRTPASDGNRQIMTFSWWMKRGNLNITDCRIFTARKTNDDQINFRDASDYNRLDVLFDGTGGGRLTTSRAFDDSSTWNHCVVAIDTTQATSGDRVKIYINGVRVTEFDTETQPSLNKNLNGFNNNDVHAIGARGWSTPGGFYDGYLAEIYFIDGQQLDASSFGQLDASTNRWIPKDASGLTFGTNGYYLDMETAPGTGSGAGTDSSGNGNNWTESGLAAADQVTDSPTNNQSTLNPLGAGATLSDGNLVATASGNSYQWALSTFAVDDGGKYVAEFQKSSGTFGYVGLYQLGNHTATTGNNYGYFYNLGTGEIIKNGSLVTDLGTGAANSLMRLEYDSATDTLEFFDDGSSIYSATTGLSGHNSLHFGCAPYASGTVITATFSPLSGTPTTGFNELTADNLPLSNGDLSAFVWIKNRDAADNHMLFDAVRGVTKDLHSNATSAEVTNANTLTRFLKNGFEVSNDAEVNTSGESYVAWQWLNDSLSTSSNTDGSVTSTVSNNSTANFSIVKYTGTGSGSSTVGHGLGVTPDMIILKHLDRGQNWRVFHTSAGVGVTGFLNDTAAFSADPDRISAVSSTTFTAAANMNESADYIAYCFAEVPGYSSIGSYTGNGSTDGPFIYTGFKPALVIIKVFTNSPTGWIILDNQRDSFNAVNHVLQPNSSDAEASGSDNWDFTSNGFKVRNTWAAANGSGYTVTFAAFAESPFKTATAR